MPARHDRAVPVAMAVADAPLALDQLSAGEQARLEALPGAARRHEWLVGRRCLKAVMVRLGMGDDTSEVTFPHPSLSVSHSGATAIAAGTQHPSVGGVGVDVETKATLPPGAARFFLTVGEQAAASPADLVRLWTTKEALFKANPANHGTVLRDYVVAAPPAWRGTARGPDRGSLRYLTMAAGHTWVTVAVAERSW